MGGKSIQECLELAFEYWATHQPSVKSSIKSEQCRFEQTKEREMKISKGRKQSAFACVQTILVELENVEDSHVYP